MALAAEPIPTYRTGTWNSDEFGNHRAVVRVREQTEAAWAHLPWRRRDANPAGKEIIVVDAKAGSRIANFFPVNITREAGDLVFQPTSGPGEYYIYFLPYEGNVKSNYPKIVYPPAQAKADAGWLARNHLTSPEEAAQHRGDFREAELVHFESVDEFDRFTAMELIATRAETEALLLQYPSLQYLVFAEDRHNSIRMTDDLSAKWGQERPGAALDATAERGEFYAFQLGVFAARAALNDVRVTFSQMNGGSAGNIAAAALRCFNTGGVDWEGKNFTRRVEVAKGKIQALWCGVQVPADAAGTGSIRG